MKINRTDFNKRVAALHQLYSPAVFEPLDMVIAVTHLCDESDLRLGTWQKDERQGLLMPATHYFGRDPAHVNELIALHKAQQQEQSELPENTQPHVTME